MGYPLPTASIPGSSFRGDDERSRRLRDLMERMAQQSESEQAMPSTADMQPPVSGYQLPGGDRSHLPDDSPRHVTPQGSVHPSVHPLQSAFPAPYSLRSGDLAAEPKGPPGPRNQPLRAGTSDDLPDPSHLSMPTWTLSGEPEAPIRFPAPPRQPSVAPRKPLQQVEAESRQRADGASARAADAQRSADASDPANARDAADAAVEGYQSRGTPANYRQRASEERDARAMSADTEAFEKAQQEHDARRRHLETKLEEARDAGNVPLQESLLEQLAQHAESAPKPTLRMTGGRTPEELDESLDGTMERLSPQERASLDAQASSYATGQDGTVNEGAKQDWLWGQFADLPPAERLAAMRAAAKQGARPAPMRVAAGEGTAGGRGSVPGGGGSPPPRGRRNPENVDVHNDEPVRAGAGTMVRTGSGAMSSRAPNMDQLEALGVDAQGNGVDPNPRVKDEDWRQRMLAIGISGFGLDRSQYAEGRAGEDQLVADTQRRLAQHQKMLGNGWETETLVTGGTRYRPVAGGKAEQTAARAGRQARTRDFLRANAVDFATAEQMWQEADGGVAPSAQTQAMRQRDNDVRNSLSDYREMQQWARQFQNPAMAQQMLRASLAEAGEDLDAQAAVMDQFGLYGPAERLRANKTAREGQAGKAKIEQQLADAETTKANAAEMAASGKEAPPDAGTHMATTRNQALDSLDGEGGPNEALAIYSTGHNQLAASDPSGKQTGIKPQEAALPVAQAIVRSPGGINSANRRVVVEMAVRQLWDKGVPSQDRGTLEVSNRWKSAEQFAEHVAKMLGDTPAVRAMATNMHNSIRGTRSQPEDSGPRPDLPAATRA